MPLKFNVQKGMEGYALRVDTEQVDITAGATEGELRRLLIDLAGEFDLPDPDE